MSAVVRVIALQVPPNQRDRFSSAVSAWAPMPGRDLVQTGGWREGGASEALLVNAWDDGLAFDDPAKSKFDDADVAELIALCPTATLASCTRCRSASRYQGGARDLNTAMSECAFLAVARTVIGPTSADGAAPMPILRASQPGFLYAVIADALNAPAVLFQVSMWSSRAALDLVPADDRLAAVVVEASWRLRRSP